MNSEGQRPFDWVQQVSRTVLKYDNTPLSGGGKPFPWEELASHITKTFEIEDFAFEEVTTNWRTPDDYLKGLGSKTSNLPVILSPLEGHAFLILSEQDLEILTNLLITKGKERTILDDPNIEEGVLQFLMVEVLHALDGLSYFSGISARLAEPTLLPQEAALTIDFSCRIGNERVACRLLVEPELQKAWKQHRAAQGPTELSKELAAKLETVVGLEVGRSQFSLKEWNQVKSGDCIVLDECSWDPNNDEYPINLTCNGDRLMRGQIKNGNLNLLETPVIQEAETPMAKTPDEDEDFDMDFEEDFDEDFEEEEEEEEEEFEEEAPETEAETEPTPAPAATPSTATAEKSSAVSAKNIPFWITVEVGRMKMTAQELMELQPGNVIELGLDPDQGVDLMANGVCVGKGELIRVGEVIGVRVIQKG